MKFLYLFTHPPYGHSIAREALDMAMASAAFEQDVSLVFAQDAIFQLLNQTNNAKAGAKPHSGLINALPLYDIEHIYYLSDDCPSRNINEAALVAHALAISPAQLTELINTADCIQSF